MIDTPTHGRILIDDSVFVDAARAREILGTYSRNTQRFLNFVSLREVFPNAAHAHTLLPPDYSKLCMMLIISDDQGKLLHMVPASNACGHDQKGPNGYIFYQPE